MAQRRAIARETKDTDGDIREILCETSLQPPARRCGRSRPAQPCPPGPGTWTTRTRPPADYRRHAIPARRQQLARQWRAFMEAQIRDQYPQPPPEMPTCQLRQTRPAAPLLADPAFSPLACTCLACTDRLNEASRLASAIGT